VILVTGGAGQMGTAFRTLLPGARYVGRTELDLTRTGEIAGFLADARPSGIVNCAAYTAVDDAEDHERLATAVNGEAVGVMAAFAAERAIPFVTFSTDYVFRGDAVEPYLESSPTDPVNAYGRSKLAGERAALNAHPGALVVRTSWVISGTHPNFVATMLRLAPERTLSVVADQHGCPTIADDLARAALEAMRRGVTGILHLTNEGPTTWYELARAAVSEAGIDPDRVRPCTTAEYPTQAARPSYSVLGSERRDGLGLEPLPHWRASLPGVVAGLGGRR
jgi:dTDP-4-dehydrorhamnose reductase